MDAPSPPRQRLRALLKDPRHYQISVLSSLLLWGVVGLDLEVAPAVAVVALAVALGTQWLGGRLAGLLFDPRSALISGLSLTLLLRTTSLAVAALAALLAIGSKFVIRVPSANGGPGSKHVFNPTNVGIALVLLLSDRAWVSPGQWGSAALAGFAVACLGFLVVRRAERSDVTWAFLGFYSGLVLGRALWLGDPLEIPLHHLSSGAFLVFAFFMISDPKTTPDSRAGRVLFALLVALGAGFVHFVLFRPNGLIWSLVALAPLVPLIDRLLPGRRYHWPGAPERRKEPAMQPRPAPSRKAPISATPISVVSMLAAALLLPVSAHAFCGFYVAKADTELFNQASKVVIARDGDRTILTMSNDYQGEPEEFAMVVPVPTFLEREQIHVGNQAAIDHLDAYTAPRLVEYHDDNPCRVREEAMELRALGYQNGPPAPSRAADAERLGVTIEATYSVGEYEILILSARESEGLETWLRQNGYRIPEGASPVIGSYLKQGMRFFVAKVDLAEQQRLGFNFLRPLQIAFESPKFMLPIRLGTVNARGPQELFVFTLTRTGRVETTNYRTVKLPTDQEIPTFVEAEFGDFYRALFDRQVERHDMRAVVLEYAWDMAWCDPCAADPLSPAELGDLGVFWLDRPGRRPETGGARPIVPPVPQAQDVFVTRLHVRYDRAHFPQDLQFQETGDRSNFQGRYVMRHPWTGSDSCQAADDYRASLAERRAREARTLADLTGWPLAEVWRKMDVGGRPPEDDDEPWWQRLWP
jgi:hypothetical protein